MAKIDTDTPYQISAEQLFERTKNRKVIPLTLSADIGLAGGIPLGATILFGGRPKCGKSSMSLQWVSNAQKLYGTKAFIFPIEGRLTHQTMQQIRGLDKSKLTVVLPPAIEDKNGKIKGHIKWDAQKWWKTIGDTIINNPNSIIIVDSLSALSSEKEQSEGMGYQGRGDTQKLEAQFCRMYGDMIVSNEVTVFFITQVQANTSGYGPPLQIKAGNAIKHQADVIMFCKGVEKWSETDGKILGHNINITIESSALGPPNVDISVPLRYGYGIDNTKDIIVNAINWNIIQTKGSWYSLPFYEKDGKLTFSEEVIGDPVKLQGEHAIWQWFNNANNQQLCQDLETCIRNKIFS